MKKIIRVVEIVLDRLQMVVFATMVGAIVWQVFARYVLEQPTAWSEELARFLVVWVTMIGSALAVRRDEHVAVTIFVDILPPAAQRVIAVIRDTLTVAMAGMLAFYGYEFAIAGGRRTSGGMGLPMLYPYAAISLGGALICLFVIARHVAKKDDPSC